MKAPTRSRKKENLRNLDYDVRGRDIPRRLFVRGRIKFAVDPRDKDATRRRAQFDLLRRWGGEGKAGAWEILHGLITGKAEPRGAVRAYEAGADDVILKPFHFEVLFARIDRRIEAARSLKRLQEDNAALDARVVERAIQIGELRDRLAQVEAKASR